ncbi:MAG: type II secretion system protein [bacterium]
MLRKLGFTMIELLIVIAVLGILAVAVLAAINPIEQINRGRDTGSRSDAEQLISAIDRYYASKGYYPWMIGANSINTSTSTATPPVFVELDGAATVGGDGEDMLANLSTGGASELKATFVSRVEDPATNRLSIFNDGVSSSSTYVCFVPKSSAFRNEAWERCGTDEHDGLDPSLPGDFPAAACPDTNTCASAETADAATDCYVCLP